MPERRWTNQEIASLLNRIADMLEIQGEIVFKVAAYRRAADAVEHLAGDIREVWLGDAHNISNSLSLLGS